jgi:hypothetical protein
MERTTFVLVLVGAKARSGPNIESFGGRSLQLPHAVSERRGLARGTRLSASCHLLALAAPIRRLIAGSHRLPPGNGTATPSSKRHPAHVRSDQRLLAHRQLECARFAKNCLAAVCLTAAVSYWL